MGSSTWAGLSGYCLIVIVIVHATCQRARSGDRGPASCLSFRAERGDPECAAAESSGVRTGLGR
eukprot:7171603-Prymnesium_polylepis.1